MKKYQPLTEHLASRREPRVAMTFADMERVLGFKLPMSARQYRPWWANSAHGHVQSRGWLDAGYQSAEVDLAAGRLVFARLNAVAQSASGERDTNAPSPRHPLIGSMRGTITIAADVDLTEPTAPDWETQVLAKFDRLLGRRT